MVRHTTYLHAHGISYAVTRMFHLTSALFTLFLAWGLSVNLAEGVSLLTMPHIPLLLLLSLAAATYRDTWRFDTATQSVTSIYGFGPFCKRETHAFGDVQRLEITHFVRGSNDKDAKANKRRLRAMLVFSLRLCDERTRTIEIIAEKTSQGRTESAMQAIASVSGLPLYVDRPRDMDLNISYKDL